MSKLSPHHEDIAREESGLSVRLSDVSNSMQGSYKSPAPSQGSGVQTAQRFTIPGESTSLNDFINSNRTHWTKGAKLKKEEDMYIMALIKQAGLVPVTQYPVNIDIIFFAKNKRKDKDNLLIGTKFILDALVRSGILQSDGWDFIGDLTFGFAVDIRNPRTVVTIY